MSDKTNIGFSVEKFGSTPAFLPISKVIINVDSDHYYESGDDTGRSVTFDCAWGTQEMADFVLADLKGYVYYPFTAENAIVDPRAELGAGVGVAGLYSILATRDVEYSPLCLMEVSAPQDEELDHEYPYKPSTQKKTEREIARTRSLITKTSEEILLQVEGVAEDLENQISGVSIKLDSITLNVDNGDTSSTIELKAGDVTISSGTINMDGLVTYSGLSSGTTTIDGGCIKTGTIDAERLNLSGSITFEDLSGNLQSDINDIDQKAETANTNATHAGNKAEEAAAAAAGVEGYVKNTVEPAIEETQDTVKAWTYSGTTYIDGTQIQTGTVSASILQGGQVTLRDYRGTKVGHIALTNTSTGTGIWLISEVGGFKIMSDGNFWVDTQGVENSYSFGVTSTRFQSQLPVTPTANNGASLGMSAFKWSDVYATNGQIQTSDLNEKTNIEYRLDKFSGLFDRIKPMSFKFKGELSESGRTHFGIGAQDLEQSIIDEGLTSNDVAAFIKSENEDGTYSYGIRYTELVPLLIYEVQSLKKKIKEMEVNGNA